MRGSVIFGVSPTKTAVVVAQTTGSGDALVIKSIRSIQFEARSGDDLKDLQQSLAAAFARHGKAHPTIALFASSPGRFKSSLEAIKAEAMIELVAAESDLLVVKVTAASLKKALGCSAGQKWRARAEERFNPKDLLKNWSKGAAGAVSAAFKVAGATT